MFADMSKVHNDVTQHSNFDFKVVSEGQTALAEITGENTVYYAAIMTGFNLMS